MSTADTERDLAVAQVPSGLFVLTASHDDHRSGVLIHWVQRCSVAPPMIVTALPMGQPVEPLIRDSRCFALCQIADDDRFLQRKFAVTPDRSDDPFVTIDTTIAVTGAPIIERAMSYLDCKLVRKLDLETDHRLLVGQVMGGALFQKCAPAVRFGLNGSSQANDCA